MSKTAVFLHSGMRTGSTYVFSKFRQIHGLYCWYEPFQQALDTAPVTLLREHGPGSWNSGHPNMDPYFLEYEPLLNPGGVGVQGFMPEFSIVNYFKNEEQLPEQYAYLASLNRYAESRGKQSILGFSKSIGRVPWMKRNFPEALHITLYRDPLQQWLSGFELYREGFSEFLFSSVLFLLNPGDNTYMQKIHREKTTTLSKTEFRLDDLYEIFLHVYGASMASAIPESDLALDIDRLSYSTVYRSAMADQIAEMAGIEIDFSDCKVRTHPIPDIGVDFASISARVVNQLMAHYGGRIGVSYDRHPYTILEKMESSIRAG